MLNNIIDGISIKLDKSFGNEYTIYSEDVEQGINEPCFFIVPLNPSKVSYPSGRTLKRTLLMYIIFLVQKIRVLK
nr:hypothetical protein [Clostridioides difficile]